MVMVTNIWWWWSNMISKVDLNHHHCDHGCNDDHHHIHLKNHHHFNMLWYWWWWACVFPKREEEVLQCNSQDERQIWREAPWSRCHFFLLHINHFPTLLPPAFAQFWKNCKIVCVFPNNSLLLADPVACICNAVRGLVGWFHSRFKGRFCIWGLFSGYFWMG